MADITLVANDLPKTVRTSDRRRDARLTLVAKAVIGNEDGSGALHEVGLRNISDCGCSFVAHFPLRIDNYYHIQIEMGPMSYASKMRVASCRVADDGDFEIGVQFVRSAAELNLLDDTWPDPAVSFRNPAIGGVRSF